MKKVVVIGKFGLKDNILDGQTVKCRTIYNELLDKYGESKVIMIDSYGWKKKPLKLFLECFIAIKNCENVILLPAHNGVRIFCPLVSLFNVFFHRRLHYVVIGSWLYDKIKNKKILKFILKNKFYGIYVETTKLKQNLNNLNFNNVFILNNYKKLNIVDEKTIEKFSEKSTLKICSFSRVNEMKGIKDAILSLNKINNQQICFKYDIYGLIDKDFEMEFNKLIFENSDFASYKGIIDSEKSVEVIKNYDILLFPTKYFTEGIPGTIIDSYASGVPVLSSKWENYKDVVDDKKTGFIYEFNDFDDMVKKLNYIYDNQNELYDMKKTCLKKASNYCKKEVLNILFKNL